MAARKRSPIRLVIYSERENMEREKLEQLKKAAMSWDIQIMTRERGYEWYKLGFALGPDHKIGEDLVKILNEAIDEILSDNNE